MKRLMILALAAATLGAFAADDAASGQKKAPRRLPPEVKARFVARTGGMVSVRGDGPLFAFVNAQKRVKTDELRKVPEELERVLNFPITIRDAERKGCSLAEAAGQLNFSTAAVVLIVDDEKIPTTALTTLESKWAVVNVAALAADKPEAEKLASRVRKEMWRTFTVLMGGANTQNYGCLMKSVFTLGELDALPYETVSPDPFRNVCRTMDKLGMTRNRSATFRKAYVEGWAPPPQTEAQRKIVEEENARGNGPKK